MFFFLWSYLLRNYNLFSYFLTACVYAYLIGLLHHFNQQACLLKVADWFIGGVFLCKVVFEFHLDSSIIHLRWWFASLLVRPKITPFFDLLQIPYLQTEPCSYKYMLLWRLCHGTLFFQQFLSTWLKMAGQSVSLAYLKLVGLPTSYIFLYILLLWSLGFTGCTEKCMI